MRRRRPRRSSSSRSALAAALLAALSACSAGPSAQQPASPGGAAGEPAEDTPLDSVKQAQVYDARGHAQACAAPQQSCPPIAPDRELADRCALAGYRMVQCGCDSLCTGDVSRLAKQHYDPEGKARDCAPATPDCSPPAASAAFQDACIEKGFHLQICGCEWLCSGRFKQP